MKKRMGKITGWIALVAGTATLAAQFVFPAAEQLGDRFPSVAEQSQQDSNYGPAQSSADDDSDADTDSQK